MTHLSPGVPSLKASVDTPIETSSSSERGFESHRRQYNDLFQRCSWVRAKVGHFFSPPSSFFFFRGDCIFFFEHVMLHELRIAGTMARVDATQGSCASCSWGSSLQELLSASPSSSPSLA